MSTGTSAFEPHGTTILCVRRGGVVAMGGIKPEVGKGFFVFIFHFKGYLGKGVSIHALR